MDCLSCKFPLYGMIIGCGSDLRYASSFSEYGCKTNGRNFEEVASLYSTNMTGVFSGGFVYEYSQEANSFGLVQLGGGSGITQLDGFNLLKQALANNAGPSGDGGYKASSSASNCPKAGQWWAPKNNSLAVLPSKAADFFKNGAGPGQGNKQGTPKCSHFCGTASTGIGKDDGSGSSSSSGDSGKKNSGNAVFANIALVLACAFTVVVFG
jgi:hypothetical protein